MTKLEELSSAINRFSEFAKWWSSINLITLSGFFLGINFFIKDINFLSLKLCLVFVYLITIILCTIIAINYLALEKAARSEYKLIKNNSKKEIDWDKIKIKNNFFKALKSWSIWIPLIIYLCYFLFLLLILFF